MELETTVRSQGNFDELLEKALTCSIIKLGKFSFNYYMTGKHGLYIHDTKEQAISYVDKNGCLVLLINTIADCNYIAGPTGLYACNSDCEFFWIDDDGIYHSLDIHEGFAHWYCGPKGLYFEKDTNQYLVSNEGEEILIFTNTPDIYIDRYHFTIPDYNYSEIKYFSLSEETGEKSLIIELENDHKHLYLHCLPKNYVVEKEGDDFFKIMPDAELEYIGCFRHETALAGQYGIYLQNGDEFSLLVVK